MPLELSGSYQLMLLRKALFTITLDARKQETQNRFCLCITSAMVPDVQHPLCLQTQHIFPQTILNYVPPKKKYHPYILNLLQLINQLTILRVGLSPRGEKDGFPKRFGEAKRNWFAVKLFSEYFHKVV